MARVGSQRHKKKVLMKICMNVMSLETSLLYFSECLLYQRLNVTTFAGTIV